MEQQTKKIYPYLGVVTETKGPKQAGSFDTSSPWKSANTAFYWMNFEFPFYHGHTDWELFIVLNDSILHRINGEEHLISEGTACLIGPKHYHATFFPNRVKNQFQGVTFPVRAAYLEKLLGLYSPTLFDELASTSQPLYFTLSRILMEKYTNMLLEIQTYEGQSTPYTEQQCNIIFSDILLKFLEQRQENSSIPDVLKPLIQHLNNPLITAQQIKMAQAELPYSYPQLTRIFKKYMHCTITQYVNRSKLQYAQELLTRTDMSLTEITSELNFESTSHFHNLFKKHFNMTPTEYRKLTSLTSNGNNE
ncbi:MAG: helix-turn-helix domain-containing protein [Clostridia bacterium]|nr:helix-turn-helix domain-containing protein [Clostridia bacterium]